MIQTARRQHPTSWIAPLTAVFAIFCSSTLLAAKPSTVTFSRDIQPILAKHCVLCHGPDESEAGLRLDRATDEDGMSAIPSVVTPGDAESSELLRRITTDDDAERMPPDADPLDPAEVALLRQWIDQGANWEQHWAFRPVGQPTVPVCDGPFDARNPIDAFVLKPLQEAGLTPSPVADRYTLIKRLYYDLTGLSPTPDAVDAFVEDDSPDAYARLVDDLLGSPHFGERWGRHWLDKARYADSDGYEKDRPRPNAWRYRDWVIDAVNRDLPFDQFTIEQLAGDLLPDATAMQRLATAFHRQTLTNTEGGVDQEEFRVEATFDRTETTAAVWMGLTMTCARCHNHKYDQIEQQEYYQMFAFFNEANEANMDVAESNRTDEQREQVADHVAGMHPEVGKLAEQLAALETQSPEPPLMNVRVMVGADRRTHVLHRGDFQQPAGEVDSGILEILRGVHPLGTRHGEGPADRLDFARWLVDPEHPLTARVAVNHVWAHLFGRGIVPTVNDFGVRGDLPTHPQLLDWLAWQFSREMGWSRKQLIRTIVNSATYRQASIHRPDLVAAERTNDYLARQNRRRVEAEIVRDLYLQAGDLLSTKIGGPSVFPPLPAGVAELSYANNFKWTTSEGADRYRRGMYTFFKRTSPHPTLISFDCPDSNTTQLQRPSSNTPLQALSTLNNEVFTEAAQGLAQRVLQRSALTDRERLDLAIRLCIVRPADASELDAFQELLTASRRHYQMHPDDAEKLASRHRAADSDVVENAAWIATTRMIMNLDEHIVRD